jgi:hypothetical protein
MYVLRTKLDKRIYGANGLHFCSQLEVHDLNVVTRLPVVLNHSKMCYKRVTLCGRTGLPKYG